MGPNGVEEGVEELMQFKVDMGSVDKTGFSPRDAQLRFEVKEIGLIRGNERN